MKIVIDKILDENIYFSTDYGMAKGIWKGAILPENIDPAVREHLMAELGIDANTFSTLKIFTKQTTKQIPKTSFFQLLEYKVYTSPLPYRTQ